MRMFETARISFQRWRALRELRAIESRDRAGGRWAFKGLIDETQDLLARGNRTRAMEVWARASAAFPEMAMQSPEALEFLVRFQCYDEAEALLTRARSQYPRSAHPQEGLALVAYGRGDREEAMTCCDLLRKNHPRSVKSYWIAAASLSELGRAEEAEAILARGIHIMPDDESLRIEYARLAERRQDWPEALKRWTDVHEIYGHLAAVAGTATALMQLGRLDEAERLLSDVIHEAGNELTVWVAHACLAEHQLDWQEAAQRWETLRRRFPEVPLGYVHGIRSLLELGRRAEAEDVLCESVERTPGDPSAAIEFAEFARRRGDQVEAARRWADVRQWFPGYIEGPFPD